MHIEVRPADLQQDRDLLTDLLSRHLHQEAGGPRFDWLYEKNPHGRAHAWLAIADADKPAGVAAAFPRRLRTGDGVEVGCVFGDFCITPQYRSLGLALQLQRACLDCIGSPSCSLGYDFPSNRMMAIYKRMQIPEFGRVVRWAKLLRLDRVATRALGSARLGRRIAAPANRLLKWKDSLFPESAQWSVREHAAECGEEFSALASSVGARYGICVDRSAAYLNWRYRGHPLRRYEMLTARRKGALAGYVVFSHTGEDASIADLFGLDDTSLWTALVAEAVAVLRSRGVIALSVAMLVSDPRAGLFRKLSFRARESCPVVVCGRSSDGRSFNGPRAPWLLMDGDRES